MNCTLLTNGCGILFLGSVWGWPPSIYMRLLALFSLLGAFEGSSWLFRGRFVTSLEYKCLRMNFWKVWVKELAWLFSTSGCDTCVPYIGTIGRSFLIWCLSLFLVKMEVLLIMFWRKDIFTFISCFPRYFFKCSKWGKSALLMHS